MPNKYRSSATVIPVDQAVGTVLAHDITEIRPGQFKGTSFKKGHVVTEKDLPHLRRLGKEHLFVLNIGPQEVHEDEAAIRLSAALSGPGILCEGPPSEGKIALRAAHDGLFKVKTEALTQISLIPEICCSSRHTNTLVRQGETVAATRAIPLVIDRNTLEEALGLAVSAGGVFSVKPLARIEAGIVITGNEVYTGLIEDKFQPILRNKLESHGSVVKEVCYAPDDVNKVAGHIRELIRKGSGLIVVAGGMSVDPDDISRVAIARAGAEDVVYGTPVLPGAMFLYGRIGQIPVLGVPACVLFYRATILDLILPRILAGEGVTRQDLAEMAHGGLCLNCETCRYPVCPFGK